MEANAFWEHLDWELGQYNHPKGLPLELWYECPLRKCEVNLFWEIYYTCPEDIQDAMKYAYDNNAKGVKITKQKGVGGFHFSIFEGRRLQFAFNTDYQVVDYD